MQAQLEAQALDPLTKIYIYEKDSKKVYIYDSLTMQVKNIVLSIESNFPHNFQICQLGNERSFILGGGDFSRLPDSMFSTRELTKDFLGIYKLTERK